MRRRLRVMGTISGRRSLPATPSRRSTAWWPSSRHQLHKVKTKLVARAHARPRETVLAGEPFLPDLSAEATDRFEALQDGPNDGAIHVEEPGSVIVKVKSFAMEPMTPDEAAEKMELLGHGFYFFSNAATGRAAVVYMRHDGTVGLIDEAG